MSQNSVYPLRGAAMRDAKNSVKNGNGTVKRLPAGQVVLVQCEGFRCLAYQDEHGLWRDSFQKQELKGPVKVLDTP